MAQLLSNLPIGAKIKFGKYSVNGETAQSIIWLVVSKNYSSVPAYPSNSITLLTEKVIDLRAFDAPEPNNTAQGRTIGGNNRYSVSNIDQWLNKSDSQWYVARHTYDSPPTNDYTESLGTGYSTRPGFLNAFSTQEINAILTTTLRVPLSHVDGGGSEDISRKIYLPSYTELGYDSYTRWEYFSNNRKMCGITSQAYTYSLCTEKKSSTDNYPYLIRTVNTSNGVNIYSVTASSDTTVGSWTALNGQVGVRPALNLSNTMRVSDTTDNEGCYTVVWNSAPSAPSVLNVPTLYGGKSNAISWSKVTDPDGDTVTYTLECSSNGGAYSVLYSGTATAYAHLIPFGTTSVQYRVKATDTSNESSTYTTSTSKSVINNNAPVIDGTDKNLGVLSVEISDENKNSIKYKVADTNADAVTVTESIDGVQIRAFRATLGTEITCEIKDNTWLALSNGSHTLTIRATDGIDSSVRTYTFTKLVNSFTIRNSTPWDSATMPTRIMLVVTRNLPSGATFKVEVCNNGYDSTPAWEDATDAVRSGLVHVFTNKSNSSGKWGVLVRVTVNRNGATGACYVSAIGGNFE